VGSLQGRSALLHAAILAGEVPRVDHQRPPADVTLA
jgi:hypothetical protein